MTSSGVGPNFSYDGEIWGAFYNIKFLGVAMDRLWWAKSWGMSMPA